MDLFGNPVGSRGLKSDKIAVFQKNLRHSERRLNQQHYEKTLLRSQSLPSVIWRTVVIDKFAIGYC